MSGRFPAKHTCNVPSVLLKWAPSRISTGAKSTGRSGERGSTTRPTGRSSRWASPFDGLSSPEASPLPRCSSACSLPCFSASRRGVIVTSMSGAPELDGSRSISTRRYSPVKPATIAGKRFSAGDYTAPRTTFLCPRGGAAVASQLSLDFRHPAIAYYGKIAIHPTPAESLVGILPIAPRSGRFPAGSSDGRLCL